MHKELPMMSQNNTILPWRFCGKQVMLWVNQLSKLSWRFRGGYICAIAKKNMCVARMQQGSHGKKLHASVDLGKVVRINYDNFHLFFLPVSDRLFIQTTTLCESKSNIPYLNFLPGKPEKRMTHFCLRNSYAFSFFACNALENLCS